MICPICEMWFCDGRHDAAQKNRAKVAKWQRENPDKVREKQRRYLNRKKYASQIAYRKRNPEKAREWARLSMQKTRAKRRLALTTTTVT